MKKDLMKFAAMGLAAGLCLSSSNVSSMDNEEIAMAKCSRDANDADMKYNDDMDNRPNTNSKCGTGSCGTNNSNDNSGCNANAARKKNKTQPSTTQVQRRSAAQKVVQGG